MSPPTSPFDCQGAPIPQPGAQANFSHESLPESMVVDPKNLEDSLKELQDTMTDLISKSLAAKKIKVSWTVLSNYIHIS
jgi:hypothetical protein